MAIVERGKVSTTPVKLVLPIPEGTREAVETIDTLRKLAAKNHERMKQIPVLKNRITTLNEIIKDLNPPVNCPVLNKEIDIHWCHSSCKKGLCQPRYSCQARLETLIDFFKIST